MFRLQKALEKAKEKRAEIRGNTPHMSPLEMISYSQTRVVELPRETLEKNRIIAGFHNDPRAQVFRTLRTKIIQKMRSNNWNTLAITSPSEEGGKSLIACNLAVALAMEVNQTVLLVDLNLRNPTVASNFGLQPENNIYDYLKGRAQPADLMVNPGIERLVVVPGGIAEGNSSELLSSPRMKAFIRETKKRYKSRIVIYDLPAVLPTDDALSVLGDMDAALLVVSEGQNTRDEIERARDLISITNLMGCVLNKSSEKVASLAQE
ncbi:Tyrosine-protein kinase Wzc [Nitrincola lacisaponensis]|uniref:Tyrosine-protein kinase Wzc n=1 Tax=Nitrincola lacisaponensis TaxID=267850 RepID=A0A063Y240_9GAMM|nr:CpsD/CapB family tyrosine-protein kinase [Nitrincola lacisaponensis]KDE39230.1 Tyrosine-protein kinase Wzc [Nitrincola lacisaponensis]